MESQTKQLVEQQEKLRKAFGNNAVLAVDAVTAADITIKQMNFHDKATEIGKKYADSFAEAILKDLDYDVTDSGKEYVRKHIIDI